MDGAVGVESDVQEPGADPDGGDRDRDGQRPGQRGPLRRRGSESHASAGAGTTPHHQEEQAWLAARFPLPPGLTGTGPMATGRAGPGWERAAGRRQPAQYAPPRGDQHHPGDNRHQPGLQAAMASPLPGAARPLAETRAAPRPVTPGQTEHAEAGQDDGPAHAEQGRILDTARAAAARGGSAAGFCGARRDDSVAVRDQLGPAVDTARGNVRPEIGNKGADGVRTAGEAVDASCVNSVAAAATGPHEPDASKRRVKAVERRKDIIARVGAGWLGICAPGPGQHQDPGPGQHQDPGPEQTPC